MHEKSRDLIVHKEKEIEPRNERMKTTSNDCAGPNLLHQQELQTFHIHNTCVNDMVVYCDVMTASRRHDTTSRDGPLCHDTIGSA